MDVSKVLIDLREELEILNAAIGSLERLQHVGPRKRAAEIRQPARAAVKRHGMRRENGLPKGK